MNQSYWEESDEDDEYEQNEIPPPTINEDFTNIILNVKHNLYDNIVLSPKLGSNDAQNNKVLEKYLKNVNDVYILSLDAENGRELNDIDNKLKKFPKESREIIKQLLIWIKDFFSKNQIPDTIPYSDYIRKSFHDYQFVQKKSFE
jgi:hypothetical protein